VKVRLQQEVRNFCLLWKFSEFNKHIVDHFRKHLVYEQRLHEQYGSLPSAPSISPDTMSKSHTRSGLIASYLSDCVSVIFIIYINALRNDSVIVYKLKNWYHSICSQAHF